MSDPIPQPEVRLQVEIGPERAGGVYANFVSVWHDADVFTLDFAAMMGPAKPAQDETGANFLFGQAQIVSRIRIPPSQVFEICKALNTELTQWEVQTGKRPPEDGVDPS